MFQSFDPTTSPDTGAARLAALRGAMAEAGLAGVMVPRADAHQGENVAPRDERLAWLTGFTGSAGFCIALMDTAGVFVDGRYTLQVRNQVDLAAFTPVDMIATRAEDWLAEALPGGGTIGFDPWLHGTAEIERLEKALGPKGFTFRAGPNLVDAIWSDQPAPPQAPVRLHATEVAGVDHTAKRMEIAEALGARGADAALLSLPDSIAWLLNIRGGDIPRTPVAHGFALLHRDGTVALYGMEDKVSEEVRTHLGNAVRLAPLPTLDGDLQALSGKTVSVDRATAPIRLTRLLQEAGATPDWHEPVALPKARKNPAELAGTRAAHLRDGAAMAEFLHWVDDTVGDGDLTEIDVVTELERIRARSVDFRDISFETICGSGPNGAIVHYRVTTESNRRITPGDILLVDSGAQYPDGTTDITRTMATGPVPPEARRAATLVLKGMIAISTARWPAGLGGRDLDALARRALWAAGLDYAHGTGHGVGAYLGVHEGPQNLSRRSILPFEPGMILSNEPGYYREGAFGIRIENLVVVTEPTPIPGGDAPMLGFETLTLCPIDRRLIDPSLLTSEEREWLDGYHMRVADALSPLVPDATQAWLSRVCAPL